MINKHFLSAGNAIFSFKNPEGHTHYFKIEKKAYKPFFISRYKGGDFYDEFNWQYLACYQPVTNRIRLTKGSPYPKNHKFLQILLWALDIAGNKEGLPDGYSLNHNGACGKCRRTITYLSYGICAICLNKSKENNSKKRTHNKYK